MRPLIGFAFVLLGIACVQGQLVVPQINNVNAIISLLPQLQGFLGQLDNILPQLNDVLSSSELQSLKDQIVQVALSQLGGNLDINTIKDKLRPILQQFLGAKPQSRRDFDSLIQQIAGATSSALPGVILGFLGKRDATDARVGLNDIIALANNFNLNTLLPQIEQFLGPEKLQELQNKVFAMIVYGLGQNWNVPSLSQALQQLVIQAVPQAAQMRIDWEAVGQAALNGIVKAIPGVVLGALFGKRDVADARAGISDILNLAYQLQLDTLLPQIEQFLGPDKVQQLQNQFFTTVLAGISNNWNPATLAQALQQLVTQVVPQAAQMRIDWEAVGQAALNGIVKAIPGVVLGALFGKRDVTDSRAGISDILNLAYQLQLDTLLPQIEQFLGPEKLQELQNQFLTTVVAGLGNNWNPATLAQVLQQLVTQFVPQAAQMRIDWGGLAQTTLETVAGNLPTIIMGAISIFGKRSLNANYQQLLSQLPVDKLAQIVQVVTTADKTVVFAKLRQLLQSFFPGNRGYINFDELAANLINNLNNLLPTLGQSVLSTILG